MRFVFPCIILLMSFGASVVYFMDGDVRKGLYWAAATVITAAVTF